MVTVKYPEIHVKLTGNDGNAFNLLGIMQKAFKKHKIPAEEISKFMNEAMSGDYNHLLKTCMEWADVT